MFPMPPTLAQFVSQSLPLYPPAFSPVVFGTLMFSFLVSTAVFYTLVRRMTRDRHRIAVTEWAKEHKADLRPVATDTLPPPIASLSPSIRWSVRSPRAHLLRLNIAERRCNVLIRQCSSTWIPTGLRPATQENSVFDPLELPVFPAYSTSERFHLISADNAAARKLSKSSARALIPADVGMLLWDQWMILEFTNRPFDPIEFGRMIALADQLVRTLP